MIYSDEVREEVLEIARKRKHTPWTRIAAELGISRVTFYRWRKEIGLLDDKSRKTSLNRRDQDGFSLKDKLNVLKETFRMNELELGEYCRSKGILSSDLERWEDEITGREQNFITAEERISLIAANRELKRELERKDKALAEAAALLVLSKKASAIWGDKEEEK